MNDINLLEGEENIKGKNKLNFDKNRVENESRNDDKIKVLNIIKEYRTKINKDRFILIIKSILSVIIIFILIIYLLINEYQKSLAKIMEENLLAFYYIRFTRGLLMGVQSSLLQIYYDSYILGNNNDLMNLNILGGFTIQLKEKYHNFIEYFLKYNLDIDHDFNLIYKKIQFVKLRGFWQKVVYESEYSSELDFIIYNIFSFISMDINSIEAQKDFDNFLFLKGRTKNEKIYTPFIKVLYYLCLNYELIYKDLFIEISDSIHDSYEKYVNKSVRKYILLEILGLLLYIAFFIIYFFI